MTDSKAGYGNDLEQDIHLLKEHCRKQYSEADNTRISQAIELLRQRFSDKQRSSGESYIHHPFRVALIAFIDIKLNANSIVAALLHDTYHDGLIEYDEVKERFGSDIATLLSGLSKISTLYTEKLSLESENFIALILTITKDVRIILLKLADRLDNVRNIKRFDDDKKLKIAKETRLLYAPIAHRLGLYHIKTEFEDISLRHIDPEAYFSIAKKLNETKKDRESYIDRFSSPIIAELNGRGYKYEIKGRPKSVNSIYSKMTKKKIDVSDIFDLFAIRIILDNTPVEREKEECWNIYSIITNIYSPNPVRLRDWISTPRPSGYESLHTTVSGPDGKWVEVQIRTRRMDEVAEKGDAAHWKYKESGKGDAHEVWLRQVREVLENKDPEAIDQLNDHDHAKNLSDIFVFTPKGDIIKMREGSTVLDFAYAIHSRVGDSCTGARVNDKIVPIKYQLQNGDNIEIITSKNQFPKLEWLNIVESQRAKAKIRRSISEREFKQAEVGREMLERKLSQLKLDYSDQVVLPMISHFKYKRALDFYQDIADEKLDIQTVKDYLVNLKNEDDNKLPETELSAVEFKQKSHNTDDFLIIEKNLINVDYKLAKCCNPIPGDAIFGFVTVDRGIQVHRMSCPNAKDMTARYPYRVIQTRWIDDNRETSFLAEIVVTGIDKIGIINHISEVISKHHKVNMRSLAINTKDGIFQGFITVFVSSIYHLDSLLVNINKIKGVLKAERLDKR